MVLIFRYQGPKGAPGMPEMLGKLEKTSMSVPVIYRVFQVPQVLSLALASWVKLP